MIGAVVNGGTVAEIDDRPNETLNEEPHLITFFVVGEHHESNAGRDASKVVGEEKRSVGRSGESESSGEGGETSGKIFNVTAKV